MSTSNTVERPKPTLVPLLLLLFGSAACNSPAPDAADAGAPATPMTMLGAAGSAATFGTSAPNTPSGPVDAGKQVSPGADAGQSSAQLDSGSTTKADAGKPDAAVLDAAVSDDALGYAAGFDELFIDAPCDAATAAPPANMATCQHPPNTQHIEKAVTFGGDPGVTYAVVLRVRGIWEPTSIAGGTRPDTKHPLTLGGTVAVGSGDPINYQQYYIKVATPAQTYWLNDYQYVAHDIHKEDYEAAIQVTGGSSVSVVMNDGNDHQIANWTEDYFEGLPPYASKPSTGQMLRLDVVSVTAP